MFQSVCYEQPLNERARVLLRLEFLFQQVDHALDGRSIWDSRIALQGLFDILALTGRNEFKGDILKELERYAATLNRLRLAPGVHPDTLDRVLTDIGTILGRIHHLDNSALEAVRQTDFLSAIHKRSQIPGGACQFDLPAFHHWLQQEVPTRTQHLREWLDPFIPMRDAVALILRLIRESATPRLEIAVRGFFQHGLDGGAPHQLIRVLLPPGAECFPEISGGRHRFTIRFLEQHNPNRRAIQSTADVAFELACCTI
ncbi:MAG: cell division protein ZapD [Candidatus Competibacteraceae bacterium]